MSFKPVFAKLLLIDVARQVVENKALAMVRDVAGGGVEIRKEFPELGQEDAHQELVTKANQGFMILDLFTASTYCQFYDALSETSRAKLNSFDILKAINVMWKTLERAKAKAA